MSYNLTAYNDSNEIFVLTRKINIFASVIIFFFGFIGNLIITIVFSLSKFRTNSGHVYLLALSIIDNLFLIVHLIEDTLRTYRDVYSLNNDDFLSFLNFVDNNQLLCQSTNYFRNLLRFISSYIVLTFSIQRLFIIFRPLTQKFKGKRSAWISIVTITTISIVANLWVPFFFKINKEDPRFYCDIDRDLKNEYFSTNMIYIFIVLIIPISILFISNSLILLKLFKHKLNRKKLNRMNVNLAAKKSADTRLTKNLIEKKLNNHDDDDEDYVRTFNQVLPINNENSFKTAKTLTIQLLFISFAFFILNLPYMITWCIFFYKTAFKEIEGKDANYLFSWLQILEIFYIFNYSINFFILLTVGSTFRMMIKNMLSCNKLRDSQQFQINLEYGFELKKMKPNNLNETI